MFHSLFSKKVKDKDLAEVVAGLSGGSSEEELLVDVITEEMLTSIIHTFSGYKKFRIFVNFPDGTDLTKDASFVCNGEGKAYMSSIDYNSLNYDIEYIGKDPINQNKDYMLSTLRRINKNGNPNPSTTNRQFAVSIVTSNYAPFGDRIGLFIAKGIPVGTVFRIWGWK